MEPAEKASDSPLIPALFTAIFIGFFIASLFDFQLCWVMENHTHTFHPSRHPKKK
jgi:hypothetical protein